MSVEKRIDVRPAHAKNIESPGAKKQMTKTQEEYAAHLTKLELILAEHIHEVEQYLCVPAGTIGDIRHDSDYLKILKMHATIEPLLNDMLEKSIGRVLKHPKVSFPGGDAISEIVLGLPLERKVGLASDSELISEQQADFIKILARVRHRYAHTIQNMSLSIGQVAEKVSPNDGGFSVKRVLFGISKEQSREQFGTVAMALLSSNIYYLFAGILATLNRGINPPPARPLLEGLFADKNPPA